MTAHAYIIFSFSVFLVYLYFYLFLHVTETKRIGQQKESLLKDQVTGPKNESSEVGDHIHMHTPQNIDPVFSRFSRVVYINLATRADRRAEFEAECERMNLKTERFEAIPHPCGALGCSKSHIQVLSQNKAPQKEQLFLILEDDVIFSEDFKARLALFWSWPLDWDVVMLGGTYESVTTTKHEGLSRVKRALSTCAYMVKGRFLPVLLENMRQGAFLLESSLSKTGHNPEFCIDMY